MTTAEAVQFLKKNDEDLILMRVSGSVRMIALDEEIQGKLNDIQRCEVLQVAFDKSKELATT